MSIMRGVKLFVNAEVMPKAITLAKANFIASEATELINKFREQSVICFIKCFQSNLGFEYLEITATDNGLVMSIKKSVVVSVSLNKPRIAVIADEKKYLIKLINDRQKNNNETFFFYHRVMETGMWGTNDNMKEEMKSWRKQKRDGTLTIDINNNRQFDVDGKTYYTLTLTQLGGGSVGLDRLGLGVSHLVDGMMYWYVSEFNRDASYKYVMKGSAPLTTD
jgi:hypothetical protein